METITQMIAEDEEYIEALDHIDTDLVNESYIISKQEAKDNRIDKLNNKMLQKVCETVIIGYENVIEEKDNIIEQQNNKIEVLEDTLKNNNVPLPSYNCNIITSSSSDAKKINDGMNRVKSFLKNKFKNGEKFYICDENGNKQKAYRKYSDNF